MPGAARRTLRVSAAHGYGHVDIAPEVHERHVVFDLVSTSGWHADPKQTHLRLGVFWEGILQNATYYPAHDATIASWMRRRHAYGHATEGGVRTLRYDSTCCHVQGECEATSCRDIILSELAEGTLSARTVGVYVGDEAAVALPMAQAPNGTLACVFQARNAQQAAMAFGEAGTTHFGFEALSDARLVLSGGFFSSGHVQQTLLAANGTVLSRRAVPAASRGVTLSIALHQRVVFEKS